MRNEIFEKISQSRKRYLTELNQQNNYKETVKEKPAEAIEQSTPIVRVKSASFQFESLKQFMIINGEIKNKLGIVLKKIPIEGIKGKLSKLTEGLQQRLRRSNERFSSNSDKLMEGFVSYSNRIFEDRYERIDTENPNMKALVLQLESSRYMSWEFADPLTHRDFIPAYSDSRLGELLNRIEKVVVRGWKNFIFSLELDGASLEFSDEIRTKSFLNEKKIIDVEEAQIDVEQEIINFSSISEQKLEIEEKYEKRDDQKILKFELKTKQFFSKQTYIYYFMRLRKLCISTINRFI